MDLYLVEIFIMMKQSKMKTPVQAITINSTWTITTSYTVGRQNASMVMEANHAFASFYCIVFYWRAHHLASNVP